MNILYTDIGNQKMYLYTPNGAFEVPYNDMYSLCQAVGQQPFVLVTSAVVSDANNISIHLKQMLSGDMYRKAEPIQTAPQNFSPQQVSTQNNPVQQTDINTNNGYHSFNSIEEAEKTGEILFIKSTVPNLLSITDFGPIDDRGRRSGVMFQNPSDIKSVDSLKPVGLASSTQVLTLLHSGQLEIIPKSQLAVAKSKAIKSIENRRNLNPRERKNAANISHANYRPPSERGTIPVGSIDEVAPSDITNDVNKASSGVSTGRESNENSIIT